ncbi:3'-5' exonuclease [Portibacter lacus]|uniref:DNA polymerase III subunit epsilon n=1 Tax=Portibacter lacus TaxID=1099794 RepID=A0AA37SVL3_9BACT|nr:3'-5' exonuclease [Portibacter lacus]GLR19626.1 DNA polymerase III subunit epsilon [Portibacter lacus]
MPKFNLKKPLIFFDIESTGLNVIRDRIVQIALIKFNPGQEEPEEMEMLINPGIPISKEAMEVHGITAADVANKPTFHQVANKLEEFIGESDLAGYNSNRFDIPMLMEEFARAGIDFEINHRNTIDVQRIFYKMEPRTLKAALKYYCGKELENAHDALADVVATIDVLEGQINRYEGVDYVDGDGFTLEAPIVNDMDKLNDFTNDLNIVDVTQRLKYDADQNIVFNFGKYMGQEVGKTLYKDRQYLNWILEKEFTHQVKKIVKHEVKTYAKLHNS